MIFSEIRFGYVLIVAGLAASAACADHPPAGPQESRVPTAGQQAQAPRTVADEFRSLAQRAPGFTGIFFDDHGRLTISVAVDTFFLPRSPKFFPGPPRTAGPSNPRWPRFFAALSSTT